MVRVNISSLDWWETTHDPDLTRVFEFFAAYDIDFNEMKIEVDEDGLHLIFDDEELAMLFKLTF